MKDSDILRAAKELINTPERWTKGCLARTQQGDPTIVDDPDAVCFCMLGALAKVSQGQNHYTGEILYEELEEPISNFNDDENTTHADVMAAFDRAIKLAEEQEE